MLSGRSGMYCSKNPMAKVESDLYFGGTVFHGGGGEGGETEIKVSSLQIYLVLLGFSLFFFLSLAKVEFLLTFR